ncbi:unnamed protein product [Aphanomyces euteiches]|uniref:Transcriptional repressor Tup1 N-terminal domain-containing protein n=1 Tax=Aphanomyces euteiches TaxID=100861 RepID=A0A6G0WAY6_9STRA|nr:hypothetical protein Ae201684_017418 [Aphanomyces euteiches]KAH9089013.1 hypothetical protein Ae201684P_012300 [Aphanomyces euteiches]KAH9110635.1 hypothetical protein LEN26_013684 [Aphanomyces euteiches]KAH9124566.1 hypothetical protein AeMF1_004688 [Aphanomyces euteiches]KAH9135392.1 hypothetical protein AeRB84_019181 [Aphanomyces euteiches]
MYRPGPAPSTSSAPRQVNGAMNTRPPSSNGGVPAMAARVVDLLDSAKHEIDVVLQQLLVVQAEKVDLERKVTAQVAEMNAILQTVKTLEQNQRRMRQQYDEDIERLRRQVADGPPQQSSSAPSNNSAPFHLRGPDVPPRSAPMAFLPPRAPQLPSPSTRLPGLTPNLMPKEDSRGMHPPSITPNNTSNTRSLPSSPAAKKLKSSSSSPQPTSSPNAGATATPSTTTPAAPTSSKIKWTFTYASRPSSDSSNDPGDRPALDLVHTIDHTSVVCCVRFSSDGRYLATGSHETAQVFDVQSGARTFWAQRPPPTTSSSASEEDAYVRAVCFSPDGTKLVAGMPQHTVRLWDMHKDEGSSSPLSLVGHAAEIYSVDASHDLIVSGSADRSVRLWNMRSGTCQAILGKEEDGPGDAVTSVALSPDGKLVAAASLDKIVRIWDVETAKLMDRLEGHCDSVYAVAFAPDGKSVVSGSLDKNVMVWDVTMSGKTTTRPRMLLQGHKDFVLSVAYAADGRWIMSGSKDRSVVCWDPRLARSVLTLGGYRNSVISVHGSSTGSYVATGSGDSFACVWKLQ